MSYICVSGNIGSGKSTLVKEISNFTGWRIAENTRPPVDEIQRLFENPKHNAFSAQISFLSRKIFSIFLELQSSESPFIVDRSPFEDIEVFGKMCSKYNWIPFGFVSAYRECALILMELIPDPFLLVYCSCKPTTCQKRLESRGRFDHKLFPKDHTRILGGLYESWVSNYGISPVITIDTQNLSPANNEYLEPFRKYYKKYCV